MVDACREKAVAMRMCYNRLPPPRPFLCMATTTQRERQRDKVATVFLLVNVFERSDLIDRNNIRLLS